MIWVYIGLALVLGVVIALAVVAAGHETNERPGYIDLTGSTTSNDHTTTHVRDRSRTTST